MKRFKQSGLTKFIRNRLDLENAKLWESIEEKYGVEADEDIEVINQVYNNAQAVVYETTMLSEIARVRLTT